MQALPFYDPSRPGIAAKAKANNGRRGDNLGMCMVRAHLMKIAVDMYGGLPRSSAIR